MDYTYFIWSVVTFIEKRLKICVSYEELEMATGFSYRHMRETFKECTKTSLGKYILSRKIANAAFDMVHSDRNISDIASEYGFDSYDTFTRAFKRETGMTPLDYRKSGYKVGRRPLVMGVYAPVILRDSKNQLISYKIPSICNELKDAIKTDKSCILYGVPKVLYCKEELTPFPSCLKACLNYMGQNINYTYLMAASGAAFRLRWNTGFWDGGNVDIMCIYEDKFEVFKRCFKAAGREYNIIQRKEVSKEIFISFIKKEINAGRPVIALGIIGPPEACLITGYENEGQRLLGWNFFQNNLEFNKDVQIHETGYFICDNWWENPSTIALMSVGEDLHELISQKDILINAIEIMTKSKINKINHYDYDFQEYAGGQEAYDAWAQAIGNDKEFSKNNILPILCERIMCEQDAEVMVGEGRNYAACFLDWVGKTNKNIQPECSKAAGYFRTAVKCTYRMNELRGGSELNETTIRKFADSETRKQIMSLIIKAKQNERKACQLLKSIISKLP